MYFCFKSHTGHTNRLVNTILTIDNEFLWQYVQNALISRYRNSLRSIDHSLYIISLNFSVFDRDNAVGIHALYMRSGNTCENRFDLHICHALCFLYRFGYGIDSTVNIDNHPFLQSL